MTKLSSMTTVLGLMHFWTPLPVAQGQGVHSEIAVLTIETAAVERLTTNDFADEEPEWSPDGARILFDSNRDGTND